MNEPRQSMVFYKSWLDAVDMIPDKANQSFLYRAILRYGLYGEEPEDIPEMLIPFWMLIKPMVEINKRKAEAGIKGGRKKKNNGSEQKETYGNKNKKPMVIESKEPMGNEVEKPSILNDNDNVNDNESSCEDSSHAREEIFISELMHNQSWKDTMAMALRTGNSEVGNLLDSFSLHCKAGGVNHGNIQDCMSHFRDWARIQLKESKKNSSVGVIQSDNDAQKYKEGW